jgi:hypothetical protein
MATATAERDEGRQPKPLWQVAVKLKELTGENRDALEDIFASSKAAIFITEAPQCAVGDYDKTHMFYQSPSNDCANRFGRAVEESSLVEYAYVDRIR